MLKQGATMEDMLWKFPHVGQQIFKKLSNKNLVKIKEVARSWEHFIINEKIYKQKVHYETMQKKKDFFGTTPLHEAAKEGKISECKLIIDNVEDKNPKGPSINNVTSISNILRYPPGPLQFVKN